jgi:uroporphyrinogen decarboxylase
VATGRARVEAALGLGAADRPPVSAWGHTYDREWDVDSLAATTVEAARRFGFDFVKLQVRATCFAEAFGGRWRYSGSPAAEPVTEHPGGTTLEDWRRIAGGEHDLTPLRDQVEAMRLVTRELGADIPVLQTVFSPGMVAWYLAGRDLRLLQGLVAEQPALLDSGLARIGEVLAGFTADSLAAGAAGVFYAINPLAGTRVISAADYERVYLPSDRIATAAAGGGWFNMLHLCGPHIDTSLVERLPMHCVNWSLHDAGNPGLRELRDRFRVAVAGGLQRHSPIQAPSAEEMRSAAAAALGETGGQGHLLTPGCSVSPWPQAKPENLEAMVAAAQSGS